LPNNVIKFQVVIYPRSSHPTEKATKNGLIFLEVFFYRDKDRQRGRSKSITMMMGVAATLQTLTGIFLRFLHNPTAG